MSERIRKYSLGIWGLGLGYFLFYTPYSGLAKATSRGLFPGVSREVPGLALLPVSVLASVFGMMTFITVAGWWKYAGRRTIGGLNVPSPTLWTFLSGVCSATVIGTTTLAFTFKGISVVLVLVLLRGGVLIIAPIVDAMRQRRVRWFSWAASGISLAAILVALGDANGYTITFLALLDIVAYVGAYFFRFQFMTHLAKSDDPAVTRRYFVEEQMIATPFLFSVLVLVSLLGPAEVVQNLRAGFEGFTGGDVGLPAMLIGLCYAGLLICTSLIFLDRRENTFCVPIHCGSSMLAGIVASYFLTRFSTLPPPTLYQMLGAVLIVVALLVLSPLHHLPVRLFLRRAAAAPAEVVHALEPAATAALQRLFVFVCAGNTSRSPIAAAICNDELARRLNLDWEAIGQSHVRAISAGVAPRTDAPMTTESQSVLRQLGVLFSGHKASLLTEDAATQSEVIYCMTRSLRDRVVEMFPHAADKTHCLDPSGDIEDPSGRDEATYARCAQRIQELVRQRLDEAGLAI